MKDTKVLVAYSLLPKGIKAIQPYLPCVVDSQRYHSDSIEHDLVLGSITHIFNKLSVVKQIQTESELLSCSRLMEDDELLPFVNLRSDRACLIEGANRTQYLALEYEKTLKFRERNVSKLEQYYLQTSIPAVLYVCETTSIMKSLMQIDSDLCRNRKSKLYFCLREHVQSNPEEITFTRFDKKTLTFS